MSAAPDPAVHTPALDRARAMIEPQLVTLTRLAEIAMAATWTRDRPSPDRTPPPGHAVR